MTTPPPQLKVRDLIALLEQQDPDAPVDTEGCDCSGPASGVEAFDGTVIITRVPGE